MAFNGRMSMARSSQQLQSSQQPRTRKEDPEDAFMTLVCEVAARYTITCPLANTKY